MSEPDFTDNLYPLYYVDTEASERRFVLVKLVNPKALYVTDFTMLPGDIITCKQSFESHEPEKVNLLLNGFNFQYRKYRKINRGQYMRYHATARKYLLYYNLISH